MRYASEPPRRQILALKAYSALHPGLFTYPHPAKEVYDVATNREEKLFWAYKCWVRALERAERGSGLEDYFKSQDLAFPLPPGFREERRLSLSAGGDLMAVDCLTDAFTPHLFDGIRGFYFGADLTMANLESTVFSAAPLGRNQRPGQPAKMNTSPVMLDRFHDGGAGIGYFSTANNHCWDYGEEGLLATLDALDARGCAHSGTGRSGEERSRAALVERNGVSMAMLSFTCDLNGNPCEKPELVNEVRFNDRTPDLSLVERQIHSARERNADAVLVHAHWGWEFELYPHVNIVDTAHRIARMGADVIVGSHPHVAQPMERYVYEKDGERRACLIIYSLGDFVSYHPFTPDSHLTYVVRFELVKGVLEGRSRTLVTGLKMLPVYILTTSDPDRTHFDTRLLPFAQVLGDPALPEKVKKELPHLNKLLHSVLLPAEPGGLVEAAEGDL